MFTGKINLYYCGKIKKKKHNTIDSLNQAKLV